MVEVEAWWLIFIPIIFALGWISSRYDVRQMLSETKRLPESYFKGLNFLLDENHDKAIDAFIEVARLDPETIELHFALGNLFRRRGEIERSIRVHQSLLNRTDLPQKDQEHALHEIGHDYFKAGMLDRAEQAFKSVLNTTYAVSANRALIRIYEAEHDWQKAIQAVQQLHTLLNEPVPQLVHYYAEMAEGCMRSKTPNFEQAAQYIDQAQQALRSQQSAGVSMHSVARLAMLRAEFARRQGQVEQEAKELELLFQKAPEFVALVADQFIQNYTQQGKADQALARLLEHYQQYFSLDLFNVLFKQLRTTQGVEKAWDFAKNSLSVHPSLLGLDKLLEVELKENSTHRVIDADIDQALLHKMIHKHTQRLDKYACAMCGFQARAFYWQCPGCNQWETYSTHRLEEL